MQPEQNKLAKIIRGKGGKPMQTATTEQLDGYLLETEERLTGNTRERQKFIAYIKNNINEYLRENPDATFDDVVSVFGMPAEIATDYIGNQHASDVKDTVGVKRIIIASTAAAVLIFTIIFGATAAVIRSRPRPAMGSTYYISAEAEKQTEAAAAVD